MGNLSSSLTIFRLRRAGAAAAASLVAVAGFLLVLELAVRSLVKPSEHSAGRIAGVELPPLRIVRVPLDLWALDRSTEVMTSAEDEAVTVGDLWGLWTLDPLLGFRQQFEARSANGWWQSNNIGARSHQPVTPDVPPGKQRVIIFGDSYAHGSRVPQADVWTTRLAQWAPHLEPVNLAGDGYSMAQAYLRYREVAATLGYQTVLLAVVPTVDLWRDVNVIRDLGEYWNLPLPMPRAVLAEDSPRLVAPPRAGLDAFFARNHPEASEELRDHLRRYDRFYFRARYETPPVIGGSVLYKVAAAALANQQEQRLRRDLRRPDSEAALVTRSLMAAMQTDATDEGADFVALIVPVESEIGPLRDDPEAAAEWRSMAEALCSGIDHCVDLAPVLTALPAECIDAGADGTHYGPRLNAALALIALQVLGGPAIETRPALTNCDISSLVELDSG